jgi:glycosyltransferase involved in cell wall biosynthesis
MRVWLLQRNEPTVHDNGGAQRILRTGIMARMLTEAGHEVVWWTSDFDHYNRRYRFNGNHREPVERGYDVQYLYSRGYKKNISYGRIMANKDVAASFATVAPADPRRPDIIIASIPTAELAWEGIEYGKGRNIPVILDVRDLWPDHIVNLAPSGLKLLVKLAMLQSSRLTRKVFAQASGIFGLTEPFLDWGLGYAGRKRNRFDRVVPMGYVKSEVVTKSDDCVAWVCAETFWEDLGVSQSEEQLVVSFIGTIGRGFDFGAVMAASRLLKQKRKNIKFVICGDGELAESLREQVKHLDNVIMPGWINKSQIKTLLLRSDVGLLPYIHAENFIKNLPNKPAEYLSEGLVLASSLPTGPLASLVDEFDCGFSYSGSVECLVEKLSFYSEQPEQLKKQKQNAIDAFNQRLNGDVVYREMIKFLETTVAQSDRRKYTALVAAV